MPLTIQDSRILIKTSTTTGQVPETAPSNDHTDGTWNTLDIYKGELFINTVDDKIWMRSDGGIIRLFTYTTVGSDITVTNGDVIQSEDGSNTIIFSDNSVVLDADTNSQVTAYHLVGVNSYASIASSGSLVKANGLAERVEIYGTNGIRLGLASTYNANLILYNAVNSNTITILSPTTSASYTLTLPTAQGSAGQTLENNGSGVLSWVTPVTGSGTVNSGTQYRLAYYAATGTAVSEAAAITSSRALVSDANGVPTHSATTSTEIGYISGLTSAIQTQLNEKVDTVRVSAAATTLADSSTYYMGAIGTVAVLASPTSDTRRQFVAKYTGVVDQVHLYFAATGGSGESITVKLANITQATSTTLTSSLNVAAATYFFNYGSLNFAVNQNDALSIQFDIPVMATNPSIAFLADVVFKY